MLIPIITYPNILHKRKTTISAYHIYAQKLIHPLFTFAADFVKPFKPSTDKNAWKWKDKYIEHLISPTKIRQLFKYQIITKWLPQKYIK